MNPKDTQRYNVVPVLCLFMKDDAIVCTCFCFLCNLALMIVQTFKLAHTACVSNLSLALCSIVGTRTLYIAPTMLTFNSNQ